jgi:hypothetical protein
MFSTQHLDGVLDHGEAIEVRVHDEIGDVAMNEEFAWLQSHDLIGRNAAVRAADPEILGRLLFGQLLKKVRLAGTDVVRPSSVVVEKVSQDSHTRDCSV